MSYYDFVCFWTHEEVGGQKSEEIKKTKKFNLIEVILDFFEITNNGNTDNGNTEKSEEQVNYSSVKKE